MNYQILSATKKKKKKKKKKKGKKTPQRWIVESKFIIDTCFVGPPFH